MKRVVILSGLAALLATGLVSVAPAQAETIRVDAVCAKLDQRVKVRGTTYQCTQSGTRTVWKVQANTVRVGRGCTREGELATVGAASRLFSCTQSRSTRQLTWKRAGKECVAAVSDTNTANTTYRNMLAQLAQIKSRSEGLSPADAATLNEEIATLERAVKGARGIINTMNSITREVCSF